ncbi:MAG: PhzF family phenazine biosynthesis protein [Haloferacaceae archaeon]
MNDDGTRTVPFGVVDAFAAEPLAGTPVGVVTDAAGLGEEAMRALAREIGAGGTAFVRSTDDAGDDGGADRRMRYVSPAAAGEYGHERPGERDGSPPPRAALAVHARLLADGRIDPGSHAVETDAGVVDVAVLADGAVRTGIGDGAPRVDPVDLDYDRVGDALGVDPAALRDVGADLPAAAAATPAADGPYLVVPVNFLERLGEADPAGDALAALADDHDAAGVCAVTFDALSADATLHARWFVPEPSGGTTEVGATGATAGAAGAYLHAGDAFDDPPDEVRIEGGHFLDRPGVVRVRVTGEGVEVGGRAVAALDGRATLPADDEDDIVVA